MDSQFLSIISLTVSILTGVIAIINHKRIRSTCCGTKLETSLDIESTTPPTIPSKLKIKVPDVNPVVEMK